MCQLLKNQVAPANYPTDKTFMQQVTELQQHWQPKPSQIVQQLNFHSCKQKPVESIAAFVAELHHLTEHCKCANLEDMLRDQLVCDTHDSHIQLKLLADTKLTFKITYATTQAIEAAQ